MRLKSVELSGFRGFAKSNKIDLDADAILLLGANGRGKTSLLDSILWALSGSVPRLVDDSHIVSMFSDSGQARVQLELSDADSGPITIIRTTDGSTQNLDVEIDGERHQGDVATSLLLDILWPESLASPDRTSAFTTSLTRSVYLQQDLVKEFIEADSEQDRFRSVSELLGAGRVTELQSELERQRLAWSRATNIDVKELDELRGRLARLNEQLSRLSPPVDRVQLDFAGQWTGWWQNIRQFELNIQLPPTTDAPEAPTALDTIVKQLEVLRRVAERRKVSIEELLLEIEGHLAETPSEESVAVNERLEAAQNELVTANEMLSEAEQQSAREREMMVKAREAREELRALAEIAMRHLDGDCPVCGQSHDEQKTRGRLDVLLSASSDSESLPITLSDSVSDFAEVVQEKQQAVLVIEAEMRQVEEIERRKRLWVVERNSRLDDLGINPDPDSDLPERLKLVADEIGLSVEIMSKLQNDGEAMALQLARAGENSRRVEVERAQLNTIVEVERLESALQSREETRLIVTKLIEALREAVHDVVDSQLKDVESVLQRVYATIDPHPAFSAVRFLSRISRGRGHLATSITDPDLDLSSDSPETILSSSQINALAVAVFLSFNLGVPSIPIEATILDDPIQNLDDVNLLGMIDLLRRSRENRQLIISTHDSRFGQLLQRKLRPIRNGQKTRIIEFNDWTREGPVIETWEIEGEIDRVLAVA